MTTPHTSKVTVVLNASGQVAAAAKHSEVSAGDATAMTSGMVAGLGQTLVEVEVPSHVTTLEAGEFLAHLAGHATTRAALAASPAGRAAASGSSQEPVSGTLSV